MVSHDSALAEAPAQEFDLYVERLELKLYAYRHRSSHTSDRGAKKRAAVDSHCARDVIDSCNAGLRAIRDSVSYDAVSPSTLINACQAVLEMTLVLLSTPDPIQELLTSKYKHHGSKWVHYWPDLSFEEYFVLLSSDEKDVLLSRVLWRTGRTVNQELSDLVQRCTKEGMMPGFEDAVNTLLPKTLDQRPGASSDPFQETEAVTFKPTVHRISKDHDRERQVRGDRAPLIHAVPVAFHTAQAAQRFAFDAREGSSFETRNNALVGLIDLISIVLRDALTRFGDEIRRHFQTEGEALVTAFRGIVDGLKPAERATVLDQAYASLRGTVLEPTVEDALEEYVQDAKFHGLFKGLDECLEALRSKEAPPKS
ncbi:hypothetical protein GQ53DRAFT_753152 [Thozetella sp. PMI_491]|nr:hypothetical protein GQ53DRAFT_753152 [Thozetella sp. PMI_491]